MKLGAGVAATGALVGGAVGTQHVVRGGPSEAAPAPRAAERATHKPTAAATAVRAAPAGLRDAAARTPVRRAASTAPPPKRAAPRKKHQRVASSAPVAPASTPAASAHATEPKTTHRGREQPRDDRGHHPGDGQHGGSGKHANRSSGHGNEKNKSPQGKGVGKGKGGGNGKAGKAKPDATSSPATGSSNQGNGERQGQGRARRPRPASRRLTASAAAPRGTRVRTRTRAPGLARQPNPARAVRRGTERGKVVAMVSRVPVLAGLLFALVMPATASAASHLVVAGETLSGIAASNGLSTAALAAANGMSPDAFVIQGTSVTVPVAEATGVSAAASPAPFGGYRVRLGDSLSAIAAEHGVSVAQLAAANGLSAQGTLVAGTSLKLPGGGGAATTSTASSSSAGSSSSGGHDVVAGDTLTGIAAANGITPAALAAANGLSPSSFVIAGTKLKIPAGAPATSVPATAAANVPATGAATGSPGRLSASQIGSIAAANGAPSSLASAIAWQESGFNNAMVSVANARGIMQVMPSTWQYVQNELGAGPLDPASPSDNVRAGSLLLSRLLRDTGGDAPTAVAAYYQGLGSVRRIGMLPETRRYVANVLALRSRFGG